ncbi:hypothetical protein D3C72_1234740 [compost metagenome]
MSGCWNRYVLGVGRTYRGQLVMVGRAYGIVRAVNDKNGAGERTQGPAVILPGEGDLRLAGKGVVAALLRHLADKRVEWRVSAPPGGDILLPQGGRQPVRQPLLTRSANGLASGGGIFRRIGKGIHRHKRKTGQPLRGIGRYL